MSKHMIQAKNSTAPFLIEPTIGHFLLFSWINENQRRKDLFEECLLKISSKFDHDFFILMINNAAERCWEEFQELYKNETGTINEEDALYLYTMMSENVTN